MRRPRDIWYRRDTARRSPPYSQATWQSPLVEKEPLKRTSIRHLVRLRNGTMMLASLSIIPISAWATKVRRRRPIMSELGRFFLLDLEPVVVAAYKRESIEISSFAELVMFSTSKTINSGNFGIYEDVKFYERDLRDEPQPKETVDKMKDFALRSIERKEELAKLPQCANLAEENGHVDGGLAINSVQSGSLDFESGGFRHCM